MSERRDSGGRRTAERRKRSRLAVFGLALLVAASAVVAGVGVNVPGGGDGAAAASGGADGGSLSSSAVAAAENATNRTCHSGIPRGPVGAANLSDADAAATGERANDSAGWATATGDVDGDGRDDLVVGAPLDDENGQNAGAAYVFLGPVNGSTLNFSAADAKLVGEGAGDRAGWSVAAANVSGERDAVVVGAPLNDEAGESAGMTYLVENPAGTASLGDADVRLPGAAAGDRLGWSVAGAENVTGDGSEELLVGAPHADATAPDSGAAYLLDRDALASGDLADAAATFLGAGERDYAGWSVAAAGDVRNASTNDLLVGARGNNSTGTGAGAAYLVHGPNATGERSLADADVTFAGESAHDNAGFSVAGAGDLDDDGRDDLVVGAPLNDGRGNNAGAAYVVYGGNYSATESLSAANVTLAGEGPDDYAGWSVAGGGDVNDDGHGDLLVGAPFNNSSAPSAGAAYLLYGSRLANDSTLAGAPAKLSGEAADDYAGYHVSSGNLSNDTASDVVVGAPYRDAHPSVGAHPNAGAVYVVYGACPEKPETATETETEPAETPTETETEPEPETATPEPTPTPDPEPLDVTVDFGCEAVTVTAEQYTRVDLYFTDGTHQRFNGLYSGPQSFAGTGENEGKSIRRVAVFNGPDSFKVIRSDAASCPELTPEETETPTETETETPTPEETETETETESPTETATATPAETTEPPALDAEIAFRTCREISVDAERYDSVTLEFADGTSRTFDGPFTGELTFRGAGATDDKVVERVVVRDGERTAAATNPNLEACLATETETETATPTETETATPTPTPTETETETPTETATATETETATEIETETPERVDAPPVRGQNTYGDTDRDEFRAVVPTGDGNYLLAGSTGDGGWAVEMDPRGQPEWEETYVPNVTGESETGGFASIIPADDGYLLVGTIYEVRNDQLSGWVVKIDESGEQQWERKISPSAWDDLHDGVRTSDGGYLLVGVTESSSAGVRGNGWAVKLGPNGDTRWQRTYGDAERNVVTAVARSDDGYLLAGNAAGSAGSPVEGWAVEIAANGDPLWDQRYNVSDRDSFATAVPLADGTYLLAGPTQGGSWSVGVDGDGTALWERTYVRTAGSVDAGLPDEDGALLVGGVGGDGLVQRVDERGFLRWETAVGGGQRGGFDDAAATSDGGYLLVGDSDGDGWVVKLGGSQSLVEPEPLPTETATPTPNETETVTPNATETGTETPTAAETDGTTGEAGTAEATETVEDTETAETAEADAEAEAESGAGTDSPTTTENETAAESGTAASAGLDAPARSGFGVTLPAVAAATGLLLAFRRR